jgi:hypothetical protein
MDPFVRNRILAPILIAIAVLGAMVLLILTFAMTLLYNTHAGSLMLAAVVAGGILFTVALISSRDRTGFGRGAAAVAAGVALPLLAGGSVALGLIGGVDDADRMINVEPHIVIPDDAPVLAAENANEFCLPENGECVPTDRWEVTPSTAEDTIAFVFDNRDEGVPHDVTIARLEGTPQDPAPGEQLLTSTIITGPAQEYWVEGELRWDELPDEWFFYCSVHPTLMVGVGTVVTD